MLNWIPNYISSLSLELQLTRLIVDKVNKSQLHGGDHLPSPKDFSRQTMVSQEIIAMAYERLEKMGIVNYSSAHVVKIAHAT